MTKLVGTRPKILDWPLADPRSSKMVAFLIGPPEIRIEFEDSDKLLIAGLDSLTTSSKLQFPRTRTLWNGFPDIQCWVVTLNAGPFRPPFPKYQIQGEDARPYPLSTNLLTTNVAGTGTMLFFRFQFALSLDCEELHLCDLGLAARTGRQTNSVPQWIRKWEAQQ